VQSRVGQFDKARREYVREYEGEFVTFLRSFKTVVATAIAMLICKFKSLKNKERIKSLRE
jgi:hypothetical protein